MAKYTTLVRSICENYSGLEESVGFDDIEQVLEGSWNKIFTSKVKFFDEEYRKPLLKKILKHFYMREIGSETVGLWKLWMNTRLEEIIPYYNKLYESELLEFDPLKDVDITRQRNTTGESTSNTRIEGNQTINENGNSSNTSKREDKYSDTPQGALDNVENGTYLTNARIVNDSGETTNTNNTTNENSSNTEGNINNTEDYLEKVTGKQGTRSYSSMLLEFRKTFLNIDLDFIHEFDDLFMGAC